MALCPSPSRPKPLQPAEHPSRCLHHHHKYSRDAANPSALPVLLRPLDAYRLCLEVSRHLLYLNTRRHQELFSILFLIKRKSVVFSLFFYTSSDSKQYKAFFYVPLERRWMNANEYFWSLCYAEYCSSYDSVPSVPVISCSDLRHIGEGWDFQ